MATPRSMSRIASLHTPWDMPWLAQCEYLPSWTDHGRADSVYHDPIVCYTRYPVLFHGAFHRTSHRTRATIVCLMCLYGLSPWHTSWSIPMDSSGNASYVVSHGTCHGVPHRLFHGAMVYPMDMSMRQVPRQVPFIYCIPRHAWCIQWSVL